MIQDDESMPIKEGVFHPGERDIQTRAGVFADAKQLGDMLIKDFMPDQHRMFFSQLPMIFVAAKDKKNDLWASVLFGEPGFVHSPDDSQLVIEQQFNPLEPLSNQLEIGSDIGLLGLELETRRRNRASMTLLKSDEKQIVLAVKQCYGNCPRFIQQRSRLDVKHAKPPESIAIDTFNTEVKNFISRSDSFFIASQYVDNVDLANNGVDMSHRGGMPGFITFNESGEMLIPDYSGNNFFNTLGNISKNPKVGLLFIDFENSRLLMLTGEAFIVWAEDESLPYTKADRMIKFRLKRGFEIKHTVPFKWSLNAYSPFSEAYKEG